MLPLGWWVVIGWMIFVIGAGVVAFIWAWKKGHFKDIEEPKYRMLEDKEPAPWPDARDGKKKLSEVQND